MSRFRLAQPGFSIYSSKPEQMVLDNLLDSPKVDTAPDPPHAGVIHLNWQDTTPVPNDTTKDLWSFPHHFKQTPIVVASYQFDNGFVTPKGTLPFQNGALGMILMDADDQNVHLKYYSFDLFSSLVGPFTMQIRFNVMAEPGY